MPKRKHICDGRGAIMMKKLGILSSSEDEADVSSPILKSTSCLSTDYTESVKLPPNLKENNLVDYSEPSTSGIQHCPTITSQTIISTSNPISTSADASSDEIFSDDTDEDPDYQEDLVSDSDSYHNSRSLDSTTLTSTEDEATVNIPEWSHINNLNLNSFQKLTDDDQYLRSDVSTENPFELFSMFLSDDVIDFMVTETNRFANQCLSKKSRNNEKLFQWTDTNDNEMRKFLAILMLMGIDRLPDMRLYWSNDDMFANAFIKRMMPRDRFITILNFWHFANNENGDSSNRIYKIEKLLNMLLCNFRAVIKPGKELVIDESMIPWRGRLVFRQYIPLKSNKYGIKLYKLCLPSGYTYNLIIYAGRTAEVNQNIGHAHKITVEITEGLLDEGRVLYGDNFYTSLPLVEELLERNTYYCGTLRRNRKGLPVDFIKKKQKKGDVDGMQNKHGIKIIKWTDKRQVLMMTSCIDHNGKMVELNKRNRFGNVVKKPDCILSYNKAKKGVDLSDQLASYYSNLRKTIKWYRKVAMELIFGTSVVNAWTLHRTFSNQKLISLIKFRTIIIKNLTANSETIIHNPVLKKNTVHQLEKISGQVRTSRRRCRHCYKKLYEQYGKKHADSKAKRVATFCGQCPDKPHFCLPCFNEVH